MKVLLLIILSGIFLLCLLLDWSLKVLPPAELRRRLRGEPKDEPAKHLLDLQSFGWLATLFIWLFGTAAAAVLIIWSSRGSYVYAALLVAVMSLLVANHHRLNQTDGPIWWLAGKKAQGLSWLLHWLDPLWQKLPKSKSQMKLSQIYELDDLLNFLDYQARKAGNRINKEDLNIAKSSLRFSGRQVLDVMSPLKEVRLVLPDESIGPHLMDELYGTGHAAFPVGKKVGRKAPPELSGLVYLDDLVSKSLQGNVAQVMNHQLSYISQGSSLAEALKRFLKKHTPLLIVIGERDEPVGVLWLEDVLSQLLGKTIKPETEIPADADAREKMVE